MSRRGRNRYVGKWIETVAQPVVLPFTPHNLRRLLEAGAGGSAEWTHQQIADWARRFVLAHWDAAEPGTELARSVEIAVDVDAQWDLRLANTYTLPELQQLDFAAESMPREWFERWLTALTPDTG